MEPGTNGSILGTPLIAVVDGEIIHSGSGTSQGYYVSVRSTLRDPATNNFLIFTYMHMRARSTASGSVKKGDRIGFVGNTGATTSLAHLHFEISNSGAVWSPAGTDRITRRINPVFFYPAGSFRGNTTIWNEVR